MRNKEFWDYHRGRMRELGTGINYFKLSRFVMYRILDALFNPKRTIEGAIKRIVKSRRQNTNNIRPAAPSEAAVVRPGKIGLRMRFTETELAGAFVIDPSPHQDDRGRFMRAWCTREFSEHGIDFLPLQSNMGFSVGKGTIRGMHYQVAPALEAKLVRCTRGSAFDVAVDLRPGSPPTGNGSAWN